LVRVLTTKAQYRELQKAAEKADKSLSTWMLEAGLDRARKPPKC